MMELIITDSTWEPPYIMRGHTDIFDLEMEDDWMLNPLLQEALFSIDKSKVIKPRIIDSPILGYITPKEISGGFKMLALMLKYKTDWKFNLNSMGSNCSRWLKEVACLSDFTAVLSYPMQFYDDDADWDIHVINDDSYPKCAKDINMSYVRCHDDRNTFYRNTNYKDKIPVDVNA